MTDVRTGFSIDEKTVLSLATEVLRMVGELLGGIGGAVLILLSDLATPIWDAINSKADPVAITDLVMQAIVRASDAEMRVELGPNT